MVSGARRSAVDADAAAHVFVSSLDDACLVDGVEGHHLQRVRRLRVGERVTAADGEGRWRSYDVAESAGGHVRLVATSAVSVEPALAPALAVAFALTKRDKPELVVQKLTELGVDRIVPVAARRSVVRWDAAKAEAARERLARIAREAAAQSRRARLPVVEAVGELAAIARHPALVVADRAGEPPRALREPDGGEWLVVVGPEGGFDAAERDVLASAARVAVGPHVLRAETAAVAVAAALAGLRSSW